MVKAKSFVLVCSLISVFAVGCVSVPPRTTADPGTGSAPDITGFVRQPPTPPSTIPQDRDTIGQATPLADNIVAPVLPGNIPWLSLPAPADRPDTGMIRHQRNPQLDPNPVLRSPPEPAYPSAVATVPGADRLPPAVSIADPIADPIATQQPGQQPAQQPAQQTPRVMDARRPAAEPTSTAGQFVDLLPSRRVSATGGAETVIRLDGENWIFLAASPDDGKVSYRRRRSLEGATEIVLRADSPGDYRIFFQRQDLLLGTVEREVIDLEVAAAAVATVGVPGGGDRVISAPHPQQDEPDHRPSEIFAGDSSQIADAANRALSAGNRELAAALWRRNQEIEGTYGVEARRGLFDVAYAFGRLAEAATLAVDMMDRQEAPPVAAVTRLAEHTARVGSSADAARMLEQLLHLLGSGPGSDVLLYELARRHENDPDSRNLRLALAYYRRITDDYPLSRYWETSRSRIEYIERHFFHLR